MKVEVLFVEGCPNLPPTMALVRESLRVRGVDVEIAEVNVRSPRHASELRFLGSPTVRIDGLDIEPEARTSLSFAFGCRTYVEAGVRSGTPPRATLERALNESALGVAAVATDSRSF